MTNHEQILDIIKHKGTISSKELDQLNIPRRCLTELVSQGKITKLKRGLYSNHDRMEDIFFSIQYGLNYSVYSNETALYLHGLTDKTPELLTLTFPHGYNFINIDRTLIIPKSSQKTLYPMGRTVMKSPSGIELVVYDLERTLCDIVKTRNHVDIQVINQVFKEYIELDYKDIPKLLSYARTLHVQNKVLRYLEVLL